MQFSRNFMPAVLAAFCLALAAGGCGQKDSISAPPPTSAPATQDTMSLDQQQAVHAHGPAGKPH